MTAAPASVIVVSRKRPTELKRCLLGLEQLAHGNYEIVVVADADGLAAVRETGLGDRVKTASFDRPNISMARNLGLSLAAGAIVAFIDDDAVPEPTWLDRLCHGIQTLDADAVAGFVRGRDGVRLAFEGGWIDAAGATHPLGRVGGQPCCPAPVADRAVKTEGVNCAFRRDKLAAIGGFDPAFAYYLDDGDVDLRLARAGGRIAVVPGAQVHHRPAASDIRRADGMPTDLFEVGASAAVFVRRHLPPDRHEGALAQARAEHRRRLLRRMVRGHCEPSDVTAVLAGYDRGVSAGLERDLPSLPAIGAPAAEFLPFVPRRPWRENVWIVGPSRELADLRSQARDRAAQGHRVSLISVSRWGAGHCVAFGNDGVWEHHVRTGIDRLQFWRVPGATALEKCAKAEIERTSPFRDAPLIVGDNSDDERKSE